MVLASRSKRARKSAFLLRCAGSTLIAISRSNRVSRARYTSPMPPAPSGATISYGPSFVRGTRGMSGRDYNPRNLSPAPSARSGRTWHLDSSHRDALSHVRRAVYWRCAFVFVRTLGMQAVSTKKITAQEAARRLASIALGVLEKMPEDERERRR